MPPTRRNEPIRTWQQGDQVSGYALVLRKQARQDRYGQDYVDLELADASGAVSAKAWPDSQALAGALEARGFVAFEGTLKIFRGQLQLSLLEIRPVRAEDRRLGFDESALIPSTTRDIGEMWRELEELYARQVERPALRSLAALALETHGEALREHPAAKSIHHAYRGGLLEHVLSMATLALGVCAHYGQLDRDLVLLGVLFHDLGKLDELTPLPSSEYSPVGRLVGHVVLGRDRLRELAAAVGEVPADLLQQLEHLVLSHHGRLEFGSPVEPATAEALVLQALDDLDAKLNQLERMRQSASGFQWVPGLNRQMYLEEP